MASVPFNSPMQQPLSRPNSQPAPTQPGFTAQTQPRPQVQQPAPTQQPTGGLASLPMYQQFMQQGSPQFGQRFGGFTGFNPGGFGSFGQQANPMMDQYRQQMQDWRDLRPERDQDMDRGEFRQDMQDWRDLRPEMQNMAPPAAPAAPTPTPTQPGFTPQAGMPQAPYMQSIGGEDPRMAAMRNMQRMRPGFGG